ncbi:hypothetical protein FRB96_006657 [Tulasnella sp. 330]|nr:hypothetical protein FRB96_006657 [Tulasnella sp. 330]
MIRARWLNPRPRRNETNVAEPPPGCAATVADSSTSAGNTLDPAESGGSDVKRVNYIYINEKNRNVNGSWAIDPKVRLPGQLLPELPSGEERVNLRINNANGSVSGELSLISDSDAPTQSSLHMRSQNGHVWVKIASRPNQRFCLNTHAESGNVIVYIPSDFEGPLTFTHMNSSLELSDEIKKRTKHITQSDTNGKAFIGNWDESRFSDKDAWNGDELSVSSKSGNIRVRFTDEKEDGLMRDLRDAGNAVTGLFKRMWDAGASATEPTPSRGGAGAIALAT